MSEELNWLFKMSLLNTFSIIFAFSTSIWSIQILYRLRNKNSSFPTQQWRSCHYFQLKE